MRMATGLDGPTERLYRLLLSKSDATVAQLAAESGCPEAEARTLLDGLVDGGFAMMIADGRYRAVAPDVVLGGRLADQLESARSGYEALREFLEIHRTGPGRGGRDDHGSWEQVTGTMAIQSRLRQLSAGARESVRTFVRDPIILGAPDQDQHRAWQDRGVRHLLLYERDVLDSDPQAAFLQLALGRGDEVRFAKRLPLKLVLVDDRATLIESPNSDRPRAIVTSNHSIVRLAATLFERLWEEAIPAPVRGCRDQDAIGEDDALLLSLLIAGLTDQSIASKLGIGLRTVQRRVRDLMDLADVDTRIQLGWHAAKHRWVS
jgi:sugar-specific transcriptional regulator TrmB